jgi:uncharacterized membrane-anchored protein
MTSKLRNLDWLAAVIYPLFVVLMEAFWVYPWLVWIGSLSVFTPPRPPLSLVSVVIVLAAAVLAVRYFLRPRWTVLLAQALIIGSGLVVILLVLGAEYRSGYGFLSPDWFVYAGRAFGHFFTRPDTILIALPALLYLWWRGINLGQATSYFKSVYNSFIIGLVALVVLMVLWQIGRSSGSFLAPSAGIGLDIIAFFFFGLLAIAVTHLYQMRGAMPREEAGLSSVWRWLPIMLVVIGGMVVVVFVLTGVFSEGFFTAVGHGFGAVSHFFGKIIEYVMVPFNYLLEGIVWIMRLALNLLRGNQNQQPNSTGNTSLTDIFPKVTPADVPSVIYAVIKWLVIAVVIAAVIYILARAVSRYRARRAPEEIEQLDESLLSWSNLNDDLKALWAMMAKNFQKKPSRAARVYHDDESGRLEIREIYRRLLREAELSGYGRNHHETPAEFSGRLGSAVPEVRGPLDQLTDVYTSVRYGDAVPPEEKVTGANSLWLTLRNLLKGISGGI